MEKLGLMKVSEAMQSQINQPNQKLNLQLVLINVQSIWS